MACTLDNIHFVISAPRSGSTWLAKALGHHPQVYATENRLFGGFCEIWRNQNGTLSPRITFDRYAEVFSRHTLVEGLGFANARQFEREFVPAYLEFLVEFLLRRSGKSIVVDKITPYLGSSDVVIQQIQRFCPNAKIIQLIRDGRDVVTSGVFDWISREDSNSPRYQRYVSKNSDVGLDRFFDEASVRKWCQYWNEPVTALQPLSDRLLEIRYEDMIADQAAQLVRLFEFIGLDGDPNLAAQCSADVDFERTTGRAQGSDAPLEKTRKGITGDWCNYFTLADAQLFVELAGRNLVALGYESDHHWVDRCPATLRQSGK